MTVLRHISLNFEINWNRPLRFFIRLALYEKIKVINAFKRQSKHYPAKTERIFFAKAYGVVYGFLLFILGLGMFPRMISRTI